METLLYAKKRTILLQVIVTALILCALCTGYLETTTEIPIEMKTSTHSIKFSSPGGKVTKSKSAIITVRGTGFKDIYRCNN